MLGQDVPVAPAIRFTALAKLTNLVRERGIFAALVHIRVVFLHRAHAAWDTLFHDDGVSDPTAEKVDLHDVTVAGPNRSAGVHYLATPWRVLHWLQIALPPATSEWSFVDLGCGKGRVLLAAGRQPYGQVVGVEFAAELAGSARHLIADACGLRAAAVDILQQDATHYDLPPTPVVVFMFNPFGPPVIDAVAAKIARSYRRTPRPIIIAYLNPRYASTFDKLPEFDEIDPGWSLAMKFKIFSPYRLKLYATPEYLNSHPTAITKQRQQTASNPA